MKKTYYIPYSYTFLSAGKWYSVIWYHFYNYSTSTYISTIISTIVQPTMIIHSEKFWAWHRPGHRSWSSPSSASEGALAAQSPPARRMGSHWTCGKRLEKREETWRNHGGLHEISFLVGICWNILEYLGMSILVRNRLWVRQCHKPSRKKEKKKHQ